MRMEAPRRTGRWDGKGVLERKTHTSGGNTGKIIKYTGTKYAVWDCDKGKYGGLPYSTTLKLIKTNYQG